MRVSFVVFGNLDERSGGFLYDRMLADRLEASGDTVSVASQRSGGFFRRLAGNSSALLRTLEAQAPDLVLIDELNHAAVFLLLSRLKKRLRVPVVALVHHLRCEEAIGPVERAMERAMEKAFLLGADAFVFNSEATASAVRSLADIVGKPALVAHPGKNRYAAYLTTRQRSDSFGLRILFLGNLIPRKNLDVLIRAAAHLPRSRWRLDVCGDDRVDPAYASRVLSLARRLAAPEAIRFHGRADDDVVGKLLAEADVLAVPSDLEGFGIVYLEAMNAGVVPVASGRGGASEIVHDGVDGFLVPPKDKAALTQRLSELLGTPALLATMREAALERAAAFPPWEESMERIRVFLHGIAEGVER